MPYAHIQFGDLRDELAKRLGDPDGVFWLKVSATPPYHELDLYLLEALRVWGLLTSFWRDRQTFPTVSGTAFYDLSTIANFADLFSYTVTDRDLVAEIQYHLLEPSTGSTWTGTEMFTLDRVTQALQRRRDQFLMETGVRVVRSTPAAPSSPVGRIQLADNIIDVRRVVWKNTSDENFHLWREDEYALTAFDVNWSVNPGTPIAYSIIAVPPLQLQLAPPPSVNATLDLITVDSGAELDPVAEVVLGIPDDTAWVVKWGALADLLSMEGQGSDPGRAAFCESRYQFGVEVARHLPSVVHAQINGVPVIPDTLAELDNFAPSWQDNSDTPTDLVLAGNNLVALRPVPDNIFSVTLDVVSKANLPTNVGSPIQIGREQLDAIIDYAEHLAVFKMGMGEIDRTRRQAANFLRVAVASNERTSAASRFLAAITELATRSEDIVPRREEGTSLGALSQTGGG